MQTGQFLRHTQAYHRTQTSNDLQDSNGKPDSTQVGASIRLTMRMIRTTIHFWSTLAHNWGHNQPRLLSWATISIGLVIRRIWRTTVPFWALQLRDPTGCLSLSLSLSCPSISFKDRFHLWEESLFPLWEEHLILQSSGVWVIFVLKCPEDHGASMRSHKWRNMCGGMILKGPFACNTAGGNAADSYAHTSLFVDK